MWQTKLVNAITLFSSHTLNKLSVGWVSGLVSERLVHWLIDLSMKGRQSTRLIRTPCTLRYYWHDVTMSEFFTTFNTMQTEYKRYNSQTKISSLHLHNRPACATEMSLIRPVNLLIMCLPSRVMHGRDERCLQLQWGQTASLTTASIWFIRKKQVETAANDRSTLCFIVLFVLRVWRIKPHDDDDDDANGETHYAGHVDVWQQSCRPILYRRHEYSWCLWHILVDLMAIGIYCKIETFNHSECPARHSTMPRSN